MREMCAQVYNYNAGVICLSNCRENIEKDEGEEEEEKGHPVEKAEVVIMSCTNKRIYGI